MCRPRPRSVVLNITSTEASTANGYVTVGPTGNLNTGTSNLNLQPGYNVPNLAIVKVGTGGKVSLYTNVGSVHLIVDVVGYYGPFGDDLFFPLKPARILDSRSSGSNTLVPKLSPMGSGAATDLPVAGSGQVPLNADAVVMNVTSTQASSNGGFTTVWPTGTDAATCFQPQLPRRDQRTESRTGQARQRHAPTTPARSACTTVSAPCS